MSTRSSLLSEIASILGLPESARRSPCDIKRKFRLPSEFQDLKSEATLSALLEWLKARSQDELVSLRRKRASKLSKSDIKQIVKMRSLDPPPTYAAIGRKFGVSGQAVKSACDRAYHSK